MRDLTEIVVDNSEQIQEERPSQNQEFFVIKKTKSDWPKNDWPKNDWIFIDAESGKEAKKEIVFDWFSNHIKTSNSLYSARSHKIADDLLKQEKFGLVLQFKENRFWLETANFKLEGDKKDDLEALRYMNLLLMTTSISQSNKIGRILKSYFIKEKSIKILENEQKISKLQSTKNKIGLSLNFAYIPGLAGTIGFSIFAMMVLTGQGIAMLYNHLLWLVIASASCIAATIIGCTLGCSYSKKADKQISAIEEKNRCFDVQIGKISSLSESLTFSMLKECVSKRISDQESLQLEAESLVAQNQQSNQNPVASNSADNRENIPVSVDSALVSAQLVFGSSGQNSQSP